MWGLLVGFGLAALGCGGGGGAPQSREELIDMQNKAQQKADADERQMQQERQLKKK
jgi:hypothetical protein